MMPLRLWCCSILISQLTSSIIVGEVLGTGVVVYSFDAPLSSQVGTTLLNFLQNCHTRWCRCCRMLRARGTALCVLLECTLALSAESVLGQNSVGTTALARCLVAKNVSGQSLGSGVRVTLGQVRCCTVVHTAKWFDS